MKYPVPNDILELSNNNPVVHNCLEYWREGFMTWEQSLMLSIVLLEKQNEQLEKNAVKAIETRPTLNHYAP